MNVTRNFPVRNTLRLHSLAEQGCVANSVEDVMLAQTAAKTAGLAFTILGHGSNIVAHSRVNRFVCQLELKGIQVHRETDEEVFLEVAAGEAWHDLVMHTLQNNWFGLENLALIPGSVGAAPVQNIGAYGVEVATMVEQVQALSPNNEHKFMSAHQCEFGYRDSIFKRGLPLTILSVQFCLQKSPSIVLEYPQLEKVMAGLDRRDITPQEMAEAVIKIRRAKLPDPSQVANVGSFFKNPVVSVEFAAALSAQIPDLVQHQSNKAIKLSAAQLIDLAGWKKRGTAWVACWPDQPLVITNIKAENASQILEFANAIKDDIRKRFDVGLELEPYELF